MKLKLKGNLLLKSLSQIIISGSSLFWDTVHYFSGNIYTKFIKEGVKGIKPFYSNLNIYVKFVVDGALDSGVVYNSSNIYVKFNKDGTFEVSLGYDSNNIANKFLE
jgi:hypothetical protein